MSSDRVGVQARIRNFAPLGFYVHCSGHCLNLVISKSCSLPSVRNFVDRLQHCCQFFLNSPKRNGLLEFIVLKNCPDSKRKPLLDLCKTRWAERHSAYQHFFETYVYIVQALELIGYRRYLDQYGDTYADWDTSSRTEAQQILSAITSFDFIVTFVTVYEYFSHMSGITVKLQRKTLDILEAFQMINEIISFYKSERTAVSTSFKRIFQESVRLASQVETEVKVPRIANRQQHRSNPEFSSPDDYYEKTVAIPLLDHIVTSLEDRFSSGAQIAASLFGIVPSLYCSKEVNFDDALEKYASDLPSPALFATEFKRWKARYERMSHDLRPTTPAQAIKDCDPDMFPNICVLLRIACTLPVTSCECERSASVLRRLNNYMRASMEKDRLSNLAPLHIHYNTEVDCDKVVDLYSRLHLRRMELDSLIQH